MNLVAVCVVMFLIDVSAVTSVYLLVIVIPPDCTFKTVDIILFCGGRGLLFKQNISNWPLKQTVGMAQCICFTLACTHITWYICDRLCIIYDECVTV